MKKFVAVAMAVLFVVGTGCTFRHSKALDTSVAAAAAGKRVSSESTGLEIFQIEINDVATAESLLTGLASKNTCRSLKNVEVDYRTWGILFVGIPKLTVSANCE